MQKSSSYRDLKSWTAQQELPPKPPIVSSSPAQGAVRDDSVTVDQATKDMTEAQKQQFILGQVNQTIEDMEAKGISVDTNKINGVERNKAMSYMNTIPRDTSPIIISSLSMALSLKDFRIILAHEINHTQLPFRKNKKGLVEAEKQCDHVMAKTYGAQAAIDALDHLDKIDQSDPNKKIPGDVHETTRKRQARIQKDFPDQHAIIPGVKPHVQVKAVIPRSLTRQP